MTTTPHTFIWFSFFQEFKFRCFFILISLILQIILSTMYTKELLSFFIAPLLSIETAKALSEVYNFACFKDTEAPMALFNPTPGAAFEEEPSRLIFTGLTEGLSATYSVCFFFAFYFSCFLILYHIYAFLIPSTFVFERLGLFFLINITILILRDY